MSKKEKQTDISAANIQELLENESMESIRYTCVFHRKNKILFIQLSRVFPFLFKPV